MEIDWNIALAAVTAVATAATAIVEWLRRRSEQGQQDPVVGCRMTWPGPGKPVGVYMDVRNRAACEIVVEKISLASPGGGKLQDQRRLQKDLVWERELTPHQSVGAEGTESSPTQSGARQWLSVLVEPPKGWPGGAVAVVLTITFNLSTARERRVTVKRVVSAPTAQQTDAKSTNTS